MDEKKDIIVVDACKVIEDKFASSTTADDATHKWTTDEIANAVYRHTGVIAPVDTVFTVLQESGYKYIVDETRQTPTFVWLLKMR